MSHRCTACRYNFKMLCTVDLRIEKARSTHSKAMQYQPPPA